MSRIQSKSTSNRKDSPKRAVIRSTTHLEKKRKEPESLELCKEAIKDLHDAKNVDKSRSIDHIKSCPHRPCKALRLKEKWELCHGCSRYLGGKYGQLDYDATDCEICKKTFCEHGRGPEGSLGCIVFCEDCSSDLCDHCFTSHLTICSKCTAGGGCQDANPCERCSQSRLLKPS